MRTMLSSALVVAMLLAAGTRLGAADDAAQRDLVRVQANEDERPWLSINARGHTAAVQALAFSADSKRLCSAGLDKVVEVWNTSLALRDLQRAWLLERSIRWQVSRGPRGAIYALAVAPSDGLLALGGYGATGALGEILLVDPAQGTLSRVLQGHRQSICSLAFSSDGQWLASLDVAGQAMLWNRKDWQGVMLYGPDQTVYGAESAGRIQRQTKLRPLAMIGARYVILPVFVGAEPDGRLRWKLQRIGLADHKDVHTFDTVHLGMVSALAASPDGSRLVSADLAGRLNLWELGPQPRSEQLAGGNIVLSLSFHPRSPTVLAGTAVSATDRKSRLQVWDLATRALVAEKSLPDHVQSCAISPDGGMAAYTGGEHHEVFLANWNDLANATPLRGAGRRVVSVACAKNPPLNRVAWGSTLREGGFNDFGVVENSFDPDALELGAGPPLKPADWLTVSGSQGRWRASRRADGALQLFRDGAPRGFVGFDPKLEGAVRCYCWLTDKAGQPTAVAVGTDVQNSVYVCGLAEQGRCPILRHFRGHQDYVTSLGASRDTRYLVSGSADGTVRFWSLADYARGQTAWGRWGAEFAVQGERLTVTKSHPAGPLFFKGVRPGDLLQRIRWRDSRGPASAERPAEIARRLAEAPWNTQIVFEFARQGKERAAFQLLPAWQPLASLFVSSEREWAFWTPEGYYDASANGNTLFGWQVNRGLESLPDFYRADQFYKNLERPDILQRLLQSGSLDGAFALAAAQAPENPDEVVQQQVAVTPSIRILTPLDGQTAPGATTTVRARIQLPGASKLTHAKAFANGVVAPRQRLLEERALPAGRELTIQWEAALPADKRNLIQVVAESDSHTAAFSNVVIERADLAAPDARPPKLYLLAMGIDEYRDSRVQPLAYSVADARAVVQLFETHASGLYDLDKATLLANREVTRTTWQDVFADLSKRLRDDARADDLLIIFMAGHGFVDPASGRYYFASYDIDADAFTHGVYGGSISWSDFELLSDVPCRKLAFLDTCHSGAIQPGRQRGLKAAIRAFQEDMVITFAASAGAERSEERADWGHGAFTKSLIEALQGKADRTSDGIITLNEVVSYVKQSVPELTRGRQNPTAAPDDLLPFVSVKLTRAEATQAKKVQYSSQSTAP